MLVEKNPLRIHVPAAGSLGNAAVWVGASHNRWERCVSAGAEVRPAGGLLAGQDADQAAQK